MTKRQTPPGRRSKARVVVVKPFGPHHCARCFGSVKASKTRARGASYRRVVTIARAASSATGSFLASMSLLLGLQCLQIDAQPIEALVPQTPVIREPRIDALEGARRDAAGPPLRLAPACDQAGPLEHLEMLGDGGATHLERPGELADRRLAHGEAR